MLGEKNTFLIFFRDKYLLLHLHSKNSVQVEAKQSLNNNNNNNNRIVYHLIHSRLCTKVYPLQSILLGNWELLGIIFPGILWETELTAQFWKITEFIQDYYTITILTIDFLDNNMPGSLNFHLVMSYQLAAIYLAHEWI